MVGLRIDPAVDHVVVVASEHRKVVEEEDTGPVAGEDNLEVVRRHLAGVGSLVVGTGCFEELRILVAEEVDVHILAAGGVALHNLAAEDMASVPVEDIGLQEAADELAEAGSPEAGSLEVDSLEVDTGQEVAVDSLVEANLVGPLMHRQWIWVGICCTRRWRATIWRIATVRRRIGHCCSEHDRVNELFRR